MTGTLRLAAYDPAWPARFAAEAARLNAALGATITGIEHVGSTAVHGLAGKPVLARAYEAEKWRVAHAVAWDKSAYSTAKGPFVEAVLARLRAGGQLASAASVPQPHVDDHSSGHTRHPTQSCDLD